MRLLPGTVLLSTVLWLVPAAHGESPSHVAVQTSAPGTCPASVVARPFGSGAVSQVSGPVGQQLVLPHEDKGEGLRIEMNAPLGRVLSADVTVEALSAKARVVDIGDGAPDISRHFHLVSESSSQQLQSRVWMQRVGAILWVDVTALRYADGSEWHASPGASCRVEPQRFMEVADGR